MSATYRSTHTLATKALRLRDSATPAAADDLPALWFFTDPERTPNPLGVAERLPTASGVVYRHFGKRDAATEAEALADIAADRHLTLLIAADPDLADKVGAHGVHLPERMIRAAARLRRRQANWIITSAVHSARAARRAEGFGIDALFASPVFPSASPSAGRALGPLRFARITSATNAPTFALGGIDAKNITRLTGLGAAGAACVQALEG